MPRHASRFWPKRKASSEHFTDAEKAEIKPNFVEIIRRTGNFSRACRVLGLSIGTAKRWMETDADFGRDVDEANHEALDDLEEEARRRAFDGVRKPVFHQGIVVGHVLEYSDGLAMFLLKVKRYPENRIKHDLTPEAAAALTRPPSLVINFVDAPAEGEIVIEHQAGD